MVNKLVSAILLTVIFSFFFTLYNYTYEFQREPDVLYFSFFSLFIYTTFYTGVINLIVTVPVSIGIEAILKNTKSYLLQLALYSVVTCIFGMLFYQLINLGFAFSMDSFLNCILLSMIAGNIFYHVNLFVIKIRGIGFNI